MIRVLGSIALLFFSLTSMAQTINNASLNTITPGQTNLWRLQWQSTFQADTSVVRILRTTESGGTETFLENTLVTIPDQFRSFTFALESSEQTYTVIVTEFKNGPNGFFEGEAIFENVTHFVEPDCPECICPSLFSPVIDFEEDDLNVTVRVLNLSEIQEIADGRSLRFNMAVTGPLGSTRTLQSNIGSFSFEGTDGNGVYQCSMTYTLDGETSFEAIFNVTARETDKRVVIPRVSGVGDFETILTINRLAQQTRLRFTLHSDIGFSATVNYDLFSYNQFDERAVAVDIGTIFGELAGPLEIQEESSSSFREYGNNRIVARSFIFTQSPETSAAKRQQFIDLFTPATAYATNGRISVPNIPENAGWIAYMGRHGINFDIVDESTSVNDFVPVQQVSKAELNKMESQPTTVIWSSGLFLDEFDVTRGVHARIQAHDSPFDGEWLIALNLANTDGRFDVRLNNRSVDSITLLPRQSSLIHLTTKDDGIDRPGFFQIIADPTELALVELRAINSTTRYVYGIITVSGSSLAVQPY